MKHTKSRLPQFKLSRSRHAKPGGGSVSLGPDWPSGTSSMCTFWHDFTLGEPVDLPAKQLAELNFCQLVSSAVVLDPHATRHLVILTFPVDQSIFGLCSTSHVCPRIMVVQPIPVT